MASQRAQQISGHLNWPKGMLAGQVAIITGSGQGIGAEAARLFANEGAKVVVADIDSGKLSTLIYLDMSTNFYLKRRQLMSQRRSTNLVVALFLSLAMS
jgi:NADP-dependent 3-hydroxy acid dehydrogenase YdfG